MRKQINPFGLIVGIIVSVLPFGTFICREIYCQIIQFKLTLIILFGSMTDLNCVFQGLDGKGAIYISTIHTAKNASLLKKNGIGAVLSIARGAQLTFSKQEIQFYLYLPADDHEAYDLSQHFCRTYDFIERARKKTNILIHCVAGISRSAAVTAAYLIKKFEYSLEKVIKHLQRKRTKIDPNPGFMRQLADFEKQMLDQKKQKEALFVKKRGQKSTSKQDFQEFLKNKSLSPEILSKPGRTIENNSSSYQKYSFKMCRAGSPNKALLLTVIDQRKEQKDRIASPASPLLKRGISIGCKIDRIKLNLKLEKKLPCDFELFEPSSPSKVYSPLLYRNRPKISVSKC